jgi:hypothetical protein
MSNMVTTAVVKNPDGSLFYRQEHEWTNLTPEMQQWFLEGLAKQQKFMDDLKASQKKTPDAIFSAVLSATGQPDLSYEAFTFDSFQKVSHEWNKLGDELLRVIEKGLKGKP